MNLEEIRKIESKRREIKVKRKLEEIRKKVLKKEQKQRKYNIRNLCYARINKYISCDIQQLGCHDYLVKPISEFDKYALVEYKGIKKDRKGNPIKIANYSHKTYIDIKTNEEYYYGAEEVINLDTKKDHGEMYEAKYIPFSKNSVYLIKLYDIIPEEIEAIIKTLGTNMLTKEEAIVYDNLLQNNEQAFNIIKTKIQKR